MYTGDNSYKYKYIKESDIENAIQISASLTRIVFTKSIDHLEFLKDCDTIIEYYDEDCKVLPALGSIINCKNCNLVQLYLSHVFELTTYEDFYLLIRNYESIIRALNSLYYSKKCNVLDDVNNQQ